MNMRKQAGKRVLSFLLCFLLLIAHLPLSALAEGEGSVGIVTADDVNVRNGPGTEHSVIGIKVNNNQIVTILGTENDTSGRPWYSVTFNKDGVSYSGYIIAQYVRIQSQTPSVPDIPVEENKTFEEELSAFPESYHAALTALHELHPSWHFTAFDTGLDWNSVLSAQNAFGRSLVNDGIISHYSTDQGYDWEKDEYAVLEGSNWYQASPQTVAYYLDPRNFLNENDIFQFEKLTFNSASQTEEAIASMLKGSFMEGKTTIGPDGTEISYAKAFLYAANAHQVSAFHLVTRCIQEVGWGGSACSLGTYPGYEGYYNFFNIGAYSGAGDGMVYAKANGWDTSFKAIFYGASFIVNGYISVGQDTPYFQKFSVVNPDYYYWHQYMTNIAAAQSEGVLQRKEYADMGLLETPFTFRIPLYQNMPQENCALPAAAGSPNNQLLSLSVEGYALTPTFDFYESLRNGVDSFTVIINGDVSAVQVSATPAGKAATVTGLGTVPIWTGENYLIVTCTAANGVAKKYTIRVILNGKGADGERPPVPEETNPSTPETPVPSGWAPPFKISGNSISGLTVGMDSASFLSSLGVYGKAYASLSDENGNNFSAGAIRTGLKLSYFDGANTTVFELLVYGDVNGDSAIDAIDLLLVRKNILGLTALNSAQTSAADVNRDGAVDAIDLLLVRKHLLNLTVIEQ